MTSIFSQGKYRQRKDWSTNSIPELVSLEEETSSQVNNEPPVEVLPPKPPRRSSLAIGLLGGRGPTDKNYKRRSSIAVTFLGRQNKVNYLTFVYLLFSGRHFIIDKDFILDLAEYFFFIHLFHYYFFFFFFDHRYF